MWSPMNQPYYYLHSSVLYGDLVIFQRDLLLGESVLLMLSTDNQYIYTTLYSL